MNIPTTPEAQGLALAELKNSPGFALFCAEFDKRRNLVRDEALTAKKNKEANRLRAAWNRLGEFEPEKMRATMETNARTKAKKGYAA